MTKKELIACLKDVPDDAHLSVIDSNAVICDIGLVLAEEFEDGICVTILGDDKKPEDADTFAIEGDPERSRPTILYPFLQPNGKYHYH